MKENRWATMDTILPEANLHVKGTIPRKRGLEFWMSQPRPEGVSIDEWEKFTTERWNRIFRGNNERN